MVFRYGRTYVPSQFFHAQKKCKVCCSYWIKKNGHQRGRQLYKCCQCGHQFLRSYRRQETPSWVSRAYAEYASGKQTYVELNNRHRKNPKTLRKYFDRYAAVTGEMCSGIDPVCLTMDATFFSRNDGVLVCRANGRNLYWREIASEMVADYAICIDTLKNAGFRFASFTIDGRRGVRQMLQSRYVGVPVQHCHFHMLMFITQRLTRRPRLEAGKELRAIALTLTRATRASFESALARWYERWSALLREKTEGTTNKRRWQYTHRRLRSAYFSLLRNLPWLFTFEEYPYLNIPRTTNSCDGSFAHWKSKVRLHRSLARQRRKKMVDYLLEGS